jgi:hypothetical protein
MATAFARFGLDAPLASGYYASRPRRRATGLAASQTRMVSAGIFGDCRTQTRLSLAVNFAHVGRHPLETDATFCEKRLVVQPIAGQMCAPTRASGPSRIGDITWKEDV